MGNEASKEKELIQNGNILEKPENGSVIIKANGLEVRANGQTVVQQNGDLHCSNPTSESAEPVPTKVETDCAKSQAQTVISENPKPAIQKEDAKKTETQKEEVKKTEVQVEEAEKIDTAEIKKPKEEKVRRFGKLFKKKTEPPPEVQSVQEKQTSSEDQPDASPPATDPPPELDISGSEAAARINPEKAETSTQTEGKFERDISTQTEEDDTTPDAEGPEEEAADEDPLDEFSVVTAEEVFEDAAHEEPFGNQTAGIIAEEVIVMEAEVCESRVFRVEWVDVSNHIRNCGNWTEAEAEAATELDTPREDEAVPEEDEASETFLHLPKDCVEAVLATESTEFTTEPNMDEAITEDDSEGNTDVSADVFLTETSEPEVHAAAPGSLPPLDEELAAMETETVPDNPEVVCMESNPSSANQDRPEEELCEPALTEDVVKVELPGEEATTEENCSSVDPSNKLVTIDELLEENFSDDEVRIESVLEILITEENTEVSEASVVDEGPETCEKVEPSPAVVEDDADLYLAPSEEDECEVISDTAKLTPEPVPEPESVSADPAPEEGEKAPETEGSDSRPEDKPEDVQPEENPVMNFFKTLVTPTKTTKKETAAPDATKDQSQTENQPAATTTVAVSEAPAAPKGMSIPPPPPPEPPRMEVKGEAAAKPVKPAPKEEPKAAAKEPEASKGKSAKDTLSRLFRPKILLGVKASKGKGASTAGAKAVAKTAAATIKEAPQAAVEVDAQPEVKAQPEVEVQPVVEVQESPVEVPQPVVEVQQAVEEVPQPVVEDEKVDPSKTGTLEAAPKPEPQPPAPEEKKLATKPSLMSLFKSKALLDHMTTKVQAASSSGVRLLRRTAGLAAEPKKATSAAPAAAEAAPPAKAKEEPKAAAAAAKPSEPAADSKPAPAAPQAGDDAANVPRKLEKRNSIHMFFKSLAQRRNSADAGVQTEPVSVAPAAK